MIQLTRKGEAPAPAILQERGKTETETICELFSNGTRQFEFKTTIYADANVKETLKMLQANKCCFCEAYMPHIAFGHVEHFRPKGGWVQNDEPMNVPGYYWLAYDWDNLFLSCEVCNTRYKRNLFPLENPNERALCHNDDVAREQPIFIHPANENPEEHILFQDDLPVGLSERGIITIMQLGLTRPEINPDRADALSRIKIIYNLALGHPDTPDREEARGYLRILYERSMTGEAEYSAMYKSFFRKHPIEAL